MRSYPCWLAVLASLVQARELDPAACASRFEVQKDKIIRTEESREMGARYLSELDVGTRQECLRLCCETDACDVFVYEEKSSGSCYLFSCGPPEDFRCKFTAHRNFSSGVLALGRRRAELQDLEASREQELANLRVHTSTTLASTTPPPPPPTTAAATRPPARRCSRYQFECHSGGECIAVYNACDGVPQCADASDEAPELGCPSAPPPDAPAPAATAPAATAAAPAAPRTEAAESPVAGAEAAHWPHRLTQAQPPRRYTDSAQSSHIFSHKGGLLQESDSNAMSGNIGQFPPFEPSWQRRPWGQPAPGYIPGIEGMGGERWPAPAPYRYDWEDPRRAWPVPQPRPEPEVPVYMPPKTMPETASVYSNQQTLRDSPKKGLDLPPRAPPAAPTAAPAAAARATLAAELPKENTTKVVKKEKPPPPAPTPHARPAAPAAPAHLQLSPDDHDGLGERPPAAVTLLVLGVLMTTAMGVLLACRARAARRRLRRGKSPFAHDADYLVNGMYL